MKKGSRVDYFLGSFFLNKIQRSENLHEQQTLQKVLHEPYLNVIFIQYFKGLNENLFYEFKLTKIYS